MNAEPRLPVSVGQEAIWLMCNSQDTPGLYHTHFYWEIPPDTDTGALRTALAALVTRHDAMRTTFFRMENGIRRLLHEVVNLDFSEIECPATCDEEFRQFLDQEARQPFNLIAGPLIRWRLIRCRDGRMLLLNVIHHLITDIGSYLLQVQDIRSLMKSGSCLDTPERMPVPLNRYPDIQSAFLASEDGACQLADWADRLEGLPTALDMATDFKRPLSSGGDAGLIRDVLSADVVDSVNSAVLRAGVRRLVGYLVSLAVTLHRYTGQREILLGLASSDRPPENAYTYDYYVNPLVIVCDFTGDPTVAELLVSINEQLDWALARRSVPFPHVVQRILRQREGGRAAVFQVAFVWEDFLHACDGDEALITLGEDGREHWNMGEAGTWVRLPRVQQWDELDLTLKVTRYPNGMAMALEYKTALFENSTARQLLDHIQVVLGKLATDADTPVCQLDLLSRQERLRMLDDWNRTQYPIESGVLTTRFEGYAQSSPDAPALVCGDQVLSYRQLNELANSLAHELIASGVGADTIVGLCLARSVEQMVGLLAILKAGGAYLPLDPDYPAERLALMLEDSSAVLVIANEDSASRLRDSGSRIFRIDRQREASDSTPVTNPAVEVAAGQAAYVIYTSGSTGRPKGVVIEHHNLNNLMATQVETFPLVSDERVLMYASLNFDVSVFAYALAWSNGACLHVAPKEELLGDGLYRYLARHRINWVLLPPPVAAQLNGELPDLRTVVVGGEACSVEVARKWCVRSRLVNLYGPTEATVWATMFEVTGPEAPPIGKPVANTRCYVLDRHLNPVPVGVPGELYLGGDCLARGYLNRADLTAERFRESPFPQIEPGRIYATGDLVRWRKDGNIEYLGRLDHQVKIRGFRIELGEIEVALLDHDAVNQVLLMAKQDPRGDLQLVGYAVHEAGATVTGVELKEWLRSRLPEFMVPSFIVVLDAFPLTPSDKVDRNALPDPFQGAGGDAARAMPKGATERAIAAVWREVLGVDEVGVHENFFDLGGHSLLLGRVQALLPEAMRKRVKIVDLFRHPTISGLAQHLGGDGEEAFFVRPDDHLLKISAMRDMVKQMMGTSVAVVGMAGRFPQAMTPGEFWDLLIAGRDCLTRFSAEELIAEGIPEKLVRHPDYVPVKGWLRGISGFDAEFFHFTPREAQITDPQQRLFLETCWEALEDAGCVPSHFEGGIGVFAGVGLNTYMLNNIASNPDIMQMVGEYPVMIGNDKDFLATRVSYKLNLNGPAMVIQSACSTSLVAVHQAVRSLLTHDCNLALAGAVSLGTCGKSGYLYQEGMIMSPDGHCRAFDAEAGGTVQGQGVGVVALKRLEDAIANNDQIYAVVKGTGVNNDGSNKVGYTAPSVEGQTRAIRSALVAADVEPQTVSYVETHGTGTPLGDPIEIEALTKAFRARTEARQYCAIGSTKPNIGHLDAAAGIAGLIKTALAMKHRKLPPSIHYEKPNPEIDFERSPFFVNTGMRDWLPPEPNCPLRAGVSAFGIGGTNAHVVLEEAPVREASAVSRPWQLLCLSARKAEALEAMTDRLADHLERHAGLNLSDVAYTLGTGRTLFDHRRFLLCEDLADAVTGLRARDATRMVDHVNGSVAPRLVFMFPGQGSQYVDMARHLYQVEVGFRETVDYCRKLLSERFVYLFESLGIDDIKGRTERLHQTGITQPALFIVEYALAKQLMDWGIRPDAMIGHSVGEYVAACLAGVFSLEQALELVVIRGQLMQEQAPGDMLAVRLGEAQLRPYLGEELDLAAVNGDDACVVSGPRAAVMALHEQLNGAGVVNQLLHTSHAFHSRMMDPTLERFARAVGRRDLQAPKIPYVSNVSGDWIRDEQAIDPAYWADHLRGTVRFSDGIATLLDDAARGDRGTVLLEVGPGRTLVSLARRHAARRAGDVLLETMRHPQEQESDTRRLLHTLGRLWQHGVEIDWERFYINRQQYRVSLPTYPFVRKRYWIEPGVGAQAVMTNAMEQTGPVTDQDSGWQLAGSEASVPTPGQSGNSLVTRLLALWASYLGIPTLSPHDDFFELGGDSLLAVRLLARISEELGVPLASHSLLQHPTVARLAARIRELGTHAESATGEASPALVMIQQGDPRGTPLCMVHPIGGEVYFYRDLAHYLGKAQPFTALQAPSLSGVQEPYTDIRVMAADYLRELRSAGIPDEHCVLGGASFGGYVAWEMAGIIHAESGIKPLVVMIDTPAPGSLPPELTDSAAVIEYLLQGQVPVSRERLLELSPEDQVTYVFEEARASNREDRLPPHLGLPLLQTWLAHQQAMHHWQAQPYGGDVLYFRHSEAMAAMPDFPSNPQENWQPLVGGRLLVHCCPGNHITMNYRPHVQHIARVLQDALASRVHHDGGFVRQVAAAPVRG